MAQKKRNEVNRKVFVNCPYDKEYEDLFTALIASLVIQGLIPMFVFEDNRPEVRIKRLFDAMESCNYSIHDISRVNVGGPMKAPRFNMPFELGMCFYKHFLTNKKHHVSVLESKSFRALQSTSDINGYDVSIHDAKPEKMFIKIRNLYRNRKRTYFTQAHFNEIFAIVKKNRKKIKDGDEVFSEHYVNGTIVLVRQLLQEADQRYRKGG